VLRPETVEQWTPLSVWSVEDGQHKKPPIQTTCAVGAASPATVRIEGVYSGRLRGSTVGIEGVYSGGLRGSTVGIEGVE
jgi:hypothetical protein